MAIARVDGATGNAGSGGSNGFSSTAVITTTRVIAVGEKLFAQINGNNGLGNVTSITVPGAGNTFVQAVTMNNGGSSSHTDLWYCDVATQIASGATITVNFTSAGGVSKNAQVVGYTGLATGGPEVTATNSGFASSQPSGTTLTTTTANSLVMAVFGEQSSGTSMSSVATGYTVGSRFENTTIGYGVCETYKVVSATGTQVATATMSGGDSWASVIATFPQASGAAPALASPPVIRLQAVNTAANW